MIQLAFQLVQWLFPWEIQDQHGSAPSTRLAEGNRLLRGHLHGEPWNAGTRWEISWKFYVFNRC